MSQNFQKGALLSSKTINKFGRRAVAVEISQKLAKNRQIQIH
jgi:hypothetical protein